MKKFTADELKQVIGNASRPAASEDGYTEAEVIEAAREVGLDAQATRASLRGVERERETRAQQAAARVSRRAQLARYILIVAVAVTGSLGVVALTVWGALAYRHTALSTQLQRVEAQRAQVRSVVARQAQTQLLWQGQPNSTERNAELTGALNRVGVETRRYDVKVRLYNEAAGSWLGRQSRGADLPARLPYSNEVRSW